MPLTVSVFLSALFPEFAEEAEVVEVALVPSDVEEPSTFPEESGFPSDSEAELVVSSALDEESPPQAEKTTKHPNRIPNNPIFKLFFSVMPPNIVIYSPFV